MKTQFAPVLLGIALSAMLGACKKADQSNTQSTIQEPSTGPATAGSKSGVVLRAKWPVGTRYVYRMDLDQHSISKIPQMPQPVEQDVTMAMTYALSVLKEMPEDGRELEMEFLANEMEVKMGGRTMMSFDSKESADNAAKNPMTEPFRRMIGSKLRLLVRANGKVDHVVGLDEWLRGVRGEGADPAGQMLTQQFNEGFFRQLADFGRGLSEKPVAVGETWPFKAEFPAGATGKIAVDAKVTLKGWENRDQHQCAILESRGTLKGTPGQEVGPMGKMVIDHGKVAGRTWFDPELGAIVEYDSDQTIQVKGEMPKQAGGNRAASAFTSDISQKVTVKLVELAKVHG